MTCAVSKGIYADLYCGAERSGGRVALRLRAGGGTGFPRLTEAAGDLQQPDRGPTGSVGLLGGGQRLEDGGIGKGGRCKVVLVSARELLEAGAHFGHRTSRQNPKMAPYIYGKRNKINIIDVRKTIKGIVTAYYFLRKVSREGKQVLFVGTKRQAKEAVRSSAEKCGSPFVVERWLGGTLTNLRTIRNRVNRLIELEKILDGPEKDKLSKKMLSSLNRERRKINRNLEGIRDMSELPGAVVLVDPNKEHNAVREARRLGVPIVAMLDTDCDPDPIDIPIPANDDALRSIEIVISTLARAVMEGRRMTVDKVEAAVPDSPAPGAKAGKVGGTEGAAAEAGKGIAAGGVVAAGAAASDKGSQGDAGSQTAARA